MGVWKRKLTMVALLLLGAPLGWAACYWFWHTHVVDGGDDPRMIFVALLCVILPALPVAWGNRTLVLRLIAYPSAFATFAWVFRPRIDGIVQYPRELGFLSQHQFHDFYPSLILPVAVVAGVVAVLFSDLSDRTRDSADQ